ncbi:MAG: DUF3089 domain-containing protein [Deltaproteobacteria bacterium]|nr:MAG: DUF3089 domain-containing protein [Deltaproteobacteria bacterium]
MVKKVCYLLIWSFLSITFVVTGCGDDEGSEGYKSQLYSNPNLWLCGAGAQPDYCLSNLDATEWLPDGVSTQLVPHTAAEETDFDCFYIYPTVHLEGPIGNVDFPDEGEEITLELDPLMSQAARFNSLCTVYAPLYRQITISTFSSPEADTYLEIAYQDVEEAFKHYMGQYNKGRPFIIMGHSQGTRMTELLLQRILDGDSELRKRFIVGLLIGGGVEVPPGDVIGGSFENIPLCTSNDELGCVIAYRTFAEDYPPPDEPGTMDSACTNPASLTTNEKTVLGGTYFPTSVNNPAFGGPIEEAAENMNIDTPFLLMRNFYTAKCAQNENGLSYLEIGLADTAGDLRENIVPFDDPLFTPNFLGLHVLDYNFVMAELLALVEQKASQM